MPTTSPTPPAPASAPAGAPPGALSGPSSEPVPARHSLGVLGRLHCWVGGVFGWCDCQEQGAWDERDRRDYRDLVKINQAVLPLVLLGLFAAGLLGLFEKTLSAVVLWCVACLSVGGLLGFLFGIPRTSNGAAGAEKAGAAEGADKRPFLRANTNLEEVSDWLTKIIVGLSLVHLQDIEARLRALSRLAAASIAQPAQGTLATTSATAAQSAAWQASGASAAGSAASNAASSVDAAQQAASAASAASAALGCTTACPPTEAAVSVAMALIVSMTVLGFLLGYLYTRLFLPAALTRSELDADEAFRKRLSQEQGRASRGAAASPDTPVVASVTDVMAAQRVAEAVPAERPDLPLRELGKLAAEYDQLRRTLTTPSFARTNKMSDIVGRMKPLTLASRDGLTSFMNSASAGERLAATVILLMYFDPRYMEWLAERLHRESAFIGFQAASALLARMNAADDSERRRIETAVRKAQAEIQQPDGPRDKLIERILAMAPGV